MITANILDPIHDVLPPSMFDEPGSTHPKLKPAHRHWISTTVKRVLEDAGYDNVDQWLSLVLTGSLTTYQYGPESDVDVSLFVNSEHFPDWSRAEMIGLMISKVDGTRLPGTVYPMQCFVVPSEISMGDLYKPGLRSGYDLKTNKWVEPPDLTRIHDVEREYNEMYIYALEQADKMERLLRYEPDKAEMLWHQIHERRRRDQKAGKGDFASSNIVYKFLANRGLFDDLSELTGEYIAKTASGAADLEWITNKEHDSLPGYVADHSFVYDPRNNKVHIGEFDRHHADLYDHLGEDWRNSPLLPGAVTHDQIEFYDDWPEHQRSAAYQAINKLHRQRPSQYADHDHTQDLVDGGHHVFGKVAELDHQAVLNQNAGQNLQGAPGPVNVPGAGKLQFHAHGDIQRMANEYNQQAGIQTPHPTDYQKVRPEISAKIAQAYDVMPHNPQDPHVAASYDALAKETKAQYDHITQNGYKFEFYPKTHDPYPNSPREAVLDLHHNKRMYVYPTSAGYGSDDAAPMDHPLLGDSGVKWNGEAVTHNDLFRAVHDFYGHAKEGLGFRADGEDNAYRQHAAMFSPLARRALASETRGQNSWVNYGPHGETNQTAGQADTVFAPQKAGLLPPWVEDANLHAPVQAKVAGLTQRQRLMHAQDLEFTLGPDTSETVHSFPNGWSVRRLKTYADMEREGTLMSNCFSFDKQNDAFTHRLWTEHPDVQRVSDDYNEPDEYHTPNGLDYSHPLGENLYSLRDEHNLPHTSIDPTNPMGGEYDLALGRHNSDPKPEHAMMISDWADAEGKHDDPDPNITQFNDIHEDFPYRAAKIASGDIEVKTHQYRPQMGKHPVTPHGRSFPWIYDPATSTLHLGSADSYHNDLILNSSELREAYGDQKGNKWTDSGTGQHTGRMSAPPNKVMMFLDNCPPDLRKALADRCGATMESDGTDVTNDFMFG